MEDGEDETWTGWLALAVQKKGERTRNTEGTKAATMDGWVLCRRQHCGSCWAFSSTGVHMRTNSMHAHACAHVHMCTCARICILMHTCTYVVYPHAHT